DRAAKLLSEIAQSSDARHLVAATPEQKTYMVELVCLAYDLGISAAHVRVELTRSISSARYQTVWIDRLHQLTRKAETNVKADGIAASNGGPGHTPDLCGQCDARPGDPVSARVVWRDSSKSTFTWCPRCHPKGIAAAETITDADSDRPAASHAV